MPQNGLAVHSLSGQRVVSTTVPRGTLVVVVLKRP